MTPRRNKGPEHIREILKSAKKEWRDAMIQSVKESDRFKEIEEQSPKFLQTLFIFIDGDPQYIRLINLN